MVEEFGPSATKSIGPVDHGAAVVTKKVGDVPELHQRAVQLHWRPAANGHTVELGDLIRVLIGDVDHAAAVANYNYEGNVSACHQRAVQLHWRPAADGNAVDLEDTSRVLIGDVDHGAAVESD